MRCPTFFTPAYVSSAKILGNSELINLYTETADVKGGKAIGGFFTTPGLDYLCTLGATQLPWNFSDTAFNFSESNYDFSGNPFSLSQGAGPVRGQIAMAGVQYVVSGSVFYSLDKNFNSTVIGNVSPFSTPVSMITNGTQIAIFDGASGFVYQSAVPATALTAAKAATFDAIDLPFTGPLSATYQDGFGLVNEVGTDAWWQSNLLDLSTWDALNFSTVDAQPDDVIAILSLKREVWLMKQYDTEIWINAGNNGFAFQRLEGVFIETGIVAPYSLTKCGERLAWLGQSKDGDGIVFASNGYQPERISTHDIENRIQQMTNKSDAVGYAYQQNGHLFYVLNFTTDNQTWVYDFTESARLGEPCWHRRAAFVNGQWQRHWGNNHLYIHGKHVIGDFQSGNLYAYNLQQPLDNGQQRRWLRSWRALSSPTDDPTRFDSLRIDMQTGMGVVNGTNPQMVLTWSDTAGLTFGPTRYAAAGKVGEVARRVKFNRLGSTRRNSGLDRTFYLSSSDVFGVALVGAELE